MDVTSEIAIGSIAGICEKLIDYPLDTIKVRAQAAAGGEGTSYGRIVATIFRERGVWTFYSGVKIPVAASSLEKAVTFLSYNSVLSWMHQRTPNYQRPAGRTLSDRSSLPEIAVGAAAAGLATSPFICGFDRVKCIMQQQGLASVTATATHVIHTEGKRSLLRGYFSTVARDMPWNAVWMTTFHIMMRQKHRWGGREDDWRTSAVAGGVAGTCGTICYPLDLVKTKIQLDNRAYAAGWRRTIGYLIKQNGIQGLYCGWSVMVTRCLPGNAVLFAVVDTLNRWHHAPPPPQTHGSPVQRKQLL